MAKSFLGGFVLLLTALAATSVAAEPKRALPERFQGRIVAVDVAGGPGPYVLKNVELGVINGRVFLVGQRHVSSPGTLGAAGQIAIAWDRVIALTTCDDRLAEAGPSSESDADIGSPKVLVRLLIGRAESAVPELRRTMHLVAKLEAELEERVRMIAELEARMPTARRDIERLRADLARGEESYEFAGKTYTAEQVKTDLAERERRLQALQSTIRDLERVRQVSQQGLECQRETIALLTTVSATKRRLEALVQTDTERSERSQWEQWLSEAEQLEKALRQQEESTGDDESQRDR